MPVVLVALEDSDACQVMFNWVLDNALQPDDALHLLHVSLKDCGSASNPHLPASDYFEQAHPETAQKVVMAMLERRFLGGLAATCPGLQPVVHLVQASMDPKTIGRIICSKAEQLGASHVYMSEGHHQSKLGALLGGTTVAQFCKQHCKVPLTIVVQAPPGADKQQQQQQHP